MAPLVEAFTAQSLLLIHGAGSVDPTRSHFDAQRFIEVGKPRDPTVVTGWLGRHLASSTPIRTTAPLRALGISNGLPQTLIGAPKTLPIASPPNFGLGGVAASKTERATWLKNDYSTAPEPVRSAAIDATATIDLLKLINFTGYAPANGAVYPNTSFATSLRSAAALIKADIGVEAIQVDIGGWDTHAAQDPNAGAMNTLMGQFSSAIAALYKDLIAGAQTQSVTVVALSEFGRNVRENGKQGHRSRTRLLHVRDGAEYHRWKSDDEQLPAAGEGESRFRAGRESHHRSSRHSRRDSEEPAWEFAARLRVPRICSYDARSYEVVRGRR